MEPETTREISTRHDDETVSIAIISTQIVSLKELMIEKLSGQDTQLELIKEETTKTNGHVAGAFREIASINAWKNKVIGGLIVSNIIVIPIMMWLIYLHIKT